MGGVGPGPAGSAVIPGDFPAAWLVAHGIDPLNLVLAVVAASCLTFLVHLAWPERTQ